MWSNHAERMHGKAHAPNLPTHPPPPSELTRCLICRHILSIGRGIKAHFRIAHVDKHKFNQPFPCPECIYQKKDDIEKINGLEAWNHHVDRVHGGTQTLSGELVEEKVGNKRKRASRAKAETASKVPDRACRRRRGCAIPTEVSPTFSNASTMIDVSSTLGTKTVVSSEEDDILSRIDSELLGEKVRRRG